MLILEDSLVTKDLNFLAPPALAKNTPEYTVSENTRKDEWLFFFFFFFFFSLLNICELNIIIANFLLLPLLFLHIFVVSRLATVSKYLHLIQVCICWARSNLQKPSSCTSRSMVFFCLSCLVGKMGSLQSGLQTYGALQLPLFPRKS